MFISTLQSLVNALTKTLALQGIGIWGNEPWDFFSAREPVNLEEADSELDPELLAEHWAQMSVPSAGLSQR